MERRRQERLRKWVPIEIDGTESGLAVTHNAHSRGMLMVTSVPMDIDSTVVITIPERVAGDRLQLSGRVVRSAKNEEDPDGLWPFAVAVEFAEDYPAFESLLRSLDP